MDSKHRRRIKDYNNPSPNSIIMVDIPIDIVYHILINLPVKTLMRLRSVCRSWNSLISDPLFQQEQHRRRSQQDPLHLMARKLGNRTNLLGLITCECTTLVINNIYMPVPLHTLPVPDDITPIQSCLGLVCLAGSRRRMVFVCNPATKKLIALPRNNGGNHVVGFGHAALSNEFKVVRWFSSPETASVIKCEIFTLGTGMWREGKSPPGPPLIQSQYHETFVGKPEAPFLQQAIHFLPDKDGPNTMVYAFDIQDEGYTMIELPEYYYTAVSTGSCNWEVRYLRELGGSLCLIFNYGYRLDIWVIKDYNSRKWVKEYEIDLSVTDINATRPLWISGDGNLLVYAESNGDKLLCCYYSGDAILQKLRNSSDRLDSAVMYVEGLLYPGSQSTTL